MKVLFALAQTSTLSPDEIKAMVDPSLLDYLRSETKRPLLKAYVVAHEGEATPQFTDGYTGNRILKFTRESVGKVFEAVKVGVKFFYDHYKKSQDEARTPVASIVGKSLRMIGDKMSTVIVAFFKDEQFASYDSISMEADLEIDESGNVSDILDFSAVALVPNGQDPALPMAKTVGQVRANNNKLSKGQFKNMSDTISLDWHTIEAGFRQLKGLPSQVTDPEEMIGRIEVTADGRLIATGKDKKYSDYVAKLVDQTVQEKLKGVNPEIEKIKSERDALAKKVTLYEVKPRVLDKAKEYKLGEGFVDFVTKRIDRFKPNENDIDGSIVEWLEDKKIDYSDMAKSSNSVSTPAGQPANTTPADEIDYTDPKNNPLLA
jgi:hypothetical protein